MAKYELNIYKGGEVEKTYAANFMPWGLYVAAADAQEHIAKMNGREKIKQIEIIILQLFDGLTSEEMQRADGSEVISLFAQLVNGNAGKGSEIIKNA